uniref:Uncharacterized protein n=1 Tax=Anguilla anguilla TaxID=7936 RepID=A0A0E9XX50_ANGAN
MSNDSNTITCIFYMAQSSCSEMVSRLHFSQAISLMIFYTICLMFLHASNKLCQCNWRRAIVVVTRCAPV